MDKHIPMRMCMACRKMKPKSELIRLVNNGGTAVLDDSMKLQQRGAYVCKSSECISLLKKKRGIERHLKADAAACYEQLGEYFL